MPSKATTFAVVCLGISDAFVPGISRSRFTPVSLRANGPEDKIVLGEILSEDIEVTDPYWIKYQAEQKGNPIPGINPKDDYTGLVDVEGFDGGDGQVGTVGSDDNFMPKYDNSEAVQKGRANTKVKGESVGGSESKKKQRVAFGYATGYADKLKEQGLVSIDEYGEDKLAARRQQLENWQNQQAVKALTTTARDEFARQTGVVYDSRRATDSYFEVLANPQSDDDKFTMIRGDAKAEKKTELTKGLVKGKITETIEMKVSFPRPAFAEIQVKNDVMSYEDFVVGFAEGSSAVDFDVSPLSGTLNRRGGEPTTLSVVFRPNAPGGDREAWIVVKTEESVFTYHVIGHVM